MTTQPPTFLTYAIVELFGHSRIAGRVTEQVIAGQGFVRVDVPLLPGDKFHEEQQGFSRIYGTSAIYSITPVSQEIAIAAAQSMRCEPVDVYLALPPRRLSEDDIESDYSDGNSFIEDEKESTF